MLESESYYCPYCGEPAEAVLDLLAAEKGWSAQRTAEERGRVLDLMGERHGVTEQTLSARNEHRSELCETTARSG